MTELIFFWNSRVEQCVENMDSYSPGKESCWVWQLMSVISALGTSWVEGLFKDSQVILVYRGRPCWRRRGGEGREGKRRRKNRGRTLEETWNISKVSTHHLNHILRTGKMLKGLWGASVEKGACHNVWQFEFAPRNPCGRRREPTSAGCPLTYTSAQGSLHAHTE